MSASAIRRFSLAAPRRVLVGFFALLLVIGGAAPGTLAVSATAQELSVPELLRHRLSAGISNRRDNGQMFQLVQPLADAVGQSVVQVLSSGRPVALGMVVSKEGYIVTKRSELSGDPIRVRLADGRLAPARVAAVRRQSDLSLLRVEKVGPLKPVQFVAEEPAVGSFLVSAGRDGQVLGLGVVSAPSRSIEHVGKLGVVLHEDDEGLALVHDVWPHSGAQEAGLIPGDLILAINGRQESGRRAVMSALGELFPGESVRLTIQREGDRVELDAQIRDLSMLQESENDARVNGPRSRRLSGFDQALQHDTVLDPNQCGGPILDSSGRVVGMNIARAGRVVSYALPAALLKSDIESLLNEAQRGER